MEKNKIFLSHRHSDTQSDCHRIRETLEEEFGKDAVFLDIENLEPGIRFADAIDKALSESKVVLVAIGPDWFGDPDENGISRLFQKNDWVRREVSAALSRSDTRVIPLLLKGATRPTADQLPEELKGLAELQTFEISITRWKYDLGVLVEALTKLIPRKKKPVGPSPYTPIPAPKPKSWWAKNYIWVLLVFVVLLVIGLIPDDETTIDIDPVDQNKELVDDQLSQGETNLLSEDNPTDNVIQESLQREDDSATPQPAQASFDYSGKWWLWENGIRSGYLLINQNGAYFNFEYYYFDNKVGQGTGEYDGTYLYTTSFVIYNNQGSYSFSFESNTRGETWEGQTQANGLLTQAELKRN